MILEAKDVKKYFIIERGAFKKESGIVRAVDGVSFGVGEFKTTGIVGESGSGKTTLAKIILKLIPPTSGEVIFNREIIKDFTKDVQIIFQNPYNSLNPKMRILDLITEPLLVHRMARGASLKDRATELLQMVGLQANVLNRYPIEFSGGQRQRICIARALASEPKLIILDEPISSLDLTIQWSILELFLKLKEKFKLTYIFISHNLAVIKHAADSVMVMKNGRLIEQGACESIFNRPKDSYTKQLLEVARA